MLREPARGEQPKTGGAACDQLSVSGKDSSGKYESVHYKAPMEYFKAIDDGVEVSIWNGTAGKLAA